MRRHAEFLLFLAAGGCATPMTTQKHETAETKDPNAEAVHFLREQVARLKPLEHQRNLAWFAATTTGADEAFEQSEMAQNALDAFYSDRAVFNRLAAIRAQGDTSDPLVARQIELLYLQMVAKQVDKSLLAEITALETQVEQAFNTYRGTVAGKERTENELKKILRASTDSQELKEAWQAQKGVGAVVAPTLVKLVKLRNDVATQLGFRDHYALSLATREQDEQALLALFDELDELTREPYLKLKAVLDERLAQRLGIPVEHLMPWHYQDPFFQNVPSVFDSGLAEVYEQQDILSLCGRFYESIGLQVDDIIARSDLYEKSGKTPHAFSADIDRGQDVRIIANIVPSLSWQETMVHELGHALYDKHKNPDLPWLLRDAAHPLTTEGIAKMFGRMVANPLWAEALGIVDAETRQEMMRESRLYLAFESLLFSRWTQVMLRFEKELYRNPDQDLNALWWDLVERYQSIARPPNRDAPDYASKIHLVIVSVYYHNYVLGDLFAAQVHETIAHRAGRDPHGEVYVGHEEVGAYLKDSVFRHGATYSWSDLTYRATGKRLSAEAFARRFRDANLKSFLTGS